MLYVMYFCLYRNEYGPSAKHEGNAIQQLVPVIIAIESPFLDEVRVVPSIVTIKCPSFDFVFL